AAAAAVAVPSSIHFLRVKWSDAERPPLAELSRADLAIADDLKGRDFDSTVVLHDRPQAPSLINILSERRVVLAWGHPYYAVHSEERLRDVNAFYNSAGG